MAIVIPGPLVQQISGSVGPVTFKRSRHGAVAAKRVTKTRGHSKELLAQQARIARLARAWHTLTTFQRSAWASLAARHSHTNALGQRIRWTGFELFIHENVLPLLADQAIAEDPPLEGRTQTFHSTITFIGQTGMLIHIVAPYDTPGARGWCFCQRCFSDRPRWPIRWTYVGFDIGPGVCAIWIQPMFLAKLGQPPAGELVRVKLIFQGKDFMLTKPFEYTHIVTAD